MSIADLAPTSVSAFGPEEEEKAGWMGQPRNLASGWHGFATESALGIAGGKATGLKSGALRQPRSREPAGEESGLPTTCALYLKEMEINSLSELNEGERSGKKGESGIVAFADGSARSRQQ